MRFVTLFTRTENIHLQKDVGLIPYYLYRNHGVDAGIATYANSEEYPLLEREVRGLKLEFIARSRLGKIRDGLRYLYRNGRGIDVLNLYHLNLSSFVWSLFFRIFCPRGRIFLKLDMDLFDLEKLKKPGPVRWVKRRTTEMAHLVTVESTWMQEQLRPLIRPSAVYLPDGAQKPRLSGPFRKEKLILTVGRLGTEQKATEILLEAFARAELPEDWRLILAGGVDPGFEPVREAFMREHPALAGRIEFTGLITEKEKLDELYLRSALFVLPSRWESFGIVLAEALFGGCYLIGSDCIPPLGDLTDGGRLGCPVKTGEIDDLAAALRRCCADPALTDPARAEQAREYAEAHFDWEKITDGLFGYLQEILS